MANLQQYQQDFVLFLEAGFIAVNQMDEQAAQQLFKASELLRPTNPMPKVGFGYLHLCKMELKEAAERFQEVLRSEPNNEMAKAFLGLTMALNPKQMEQGEKILAETATHSSDPSVKKLAEDTIDFVDSFLKKGATPGPAQPSEKNKAKKKKK
jgi:hypothetical protein